MTLTLGLNIGFHRWRGVGAGADLLDARLVLGWVTFWTPRPDYDAVKARLAGTARRLRGSRDRSGL